MPSTDMGSAINSRLTTAVEYGPDPRGWGMFSRLSRVLQRGISGTTGTRVVDTQERFNGYTRSPQSFTGMAPLGLAAPIVKSTSVLSDERTAGALDDTALRIFAERLKRGKA